MRSERPKRPSQRATGERLTATQLDWLKDVEAGRDPLQRRVGFSRRKQATTNNPTVASLQRCGFLDVDGRITDAGRARLSNSNTLPVPIPGRKYTLRNVRYIGGHQEAIVDALDKKLGKPEEPKTL